MKALILLLVMQYASCGLYPRDSSSRESKSLDGIWSFKLSDKMDPDVGFREEWYQAPLDLKNDVIHMPVPSSYNDITVDPNIRDYVGWVWYGRRFFVPQSWREQSVFVRFGSVHYTGAVYVNGRHVGSHSGGHLPFSFNLSAVLNFSQENWITVAVNNTLTRYTVPQGSVVWKNDDDNYSPGYSTLEIGFDFFNYAGIHRPVILYTLPRDLYVSDITTSTLVSSDHLLATLTVDVEFTLAAGSKQQDGVQCDIKLLDKSGVVVGDLHSCQGDIKIKNPALWWPYLMSETPGYMHQLLVTVSHVRYGSDVYQLPIGLREVSWGSSAFQINHENFYFTGFGRHEDSNIRGKGLDLPLVLRDYNLIKWIGANSYRTSHYPYADEIMDLADENGIVIIDECPAVALDHFEDELLVNHLKSLKELVDRDKNRPSVVMWSVGNEPKSYRNDSGIYFEKVYNFTRSLDGTRAITLVINADYKTEQASQHFDVIAINRYFGWYSDTGHLEVIYKHMLNDLKHWRESRGKPVMVTEYGADTVPGIHTLPAVVFSEEYQIQLMKENFKAFDEAKAEGWFIGEMIWNFADFMTKQDITRVNGNKKGIFTREREPKMAAHMLRWRYWQLAQNGTKNKMPNNIWTF
ncbi:beta-glucuronidase [Eurytemora carolleeae]|uniref:beta-glucuronidase n=1 Tax=Eurytemora carolleeae TaxID=1294199 RepID=UPI000C78C5B9|nr:beta-glucuronidase [Eurytemora carolleeae]|eukprot:XP_023331589.1 beta-glucuronidase-like [Eurytemora affinis]